MGHDIPELRYIHPAEPIWPLFGGGVDRHHFVGQIFQNMCHLGCITWYTSPTPPVTLPPRSEPTAPPSSQEHSHRPNLQWEVKEDPNHPERHRCGVDFPMTYHPMGRGQVWYIYLICHKNQAFIVGKYTINGWCWVLDAKGFIQQKSGPPQPTTLPETNSPLPEVFRSSTTSPL